MADYLPAFLRKFRNSSDWVDERPIRAELFSVERLEQYARTIAAEHRIVRKKGSALFLRRFEDNSRELVATHNKVVEAVSSGRSISPAGEWLIDNFHIVEDQLRQVPHDLPRSHYFELPKLAAGELKDYPRIYAMALGLIEHTDSRLDSNILRRFVAAYQTEAPLSTIELWTLLSILRVALVENLRRLVRPIVGSRQQRDQADQLADKLLELASRDPAILVPFIMSQLGRQERLPAAFVVQLMQRLREQDPTVFPVIDWIVKQLDRQGSNIEEIIHLQHQRQAADQVTIGNVIASMRQLSALDWPKFFESVSLIDPLLERDPAGAYAKMEFESRDSYRRVVERISKRTGFNELQIAEAALDLAADAARRDGGAGPQIHVGYFLIDAGLAQLESIFSYRLSLTERLSRWCVANPAFVYLGLTTLLTATIVGSLGVFAFTTGAGWRGVAMTLLLALIPAGEIARTIFNWDCRQLLEPQLVPRMNTSEGVGEDARTIVVIPAILSDEAIVHELVEKLEVHFLANSDENIHFALLGDFADADSQVLPGDSVIIDLALDSIAKLNQRYGKDRFHFFHRRRVWNPSQGKWMGWERKSGKLHEFNRILRSSSDTSFLVQTAEQALLSGVRFVISIDSGTQLPREVARKLIGTASHPLNRPEFDRTLNRVKAGYAILQPRLSVSVDSARRSRFTRLFSGNSGIDPSSTPVSDVYQDLFREGTYAGNGLYDVDAFEFVMAGRKPANTLLTHDLFDSLAARTALLSDVEIFLDQPSHYQSYAQRLHRRTRGDWQTLRWLFPYVPDATGNRVRNTISLIARVKLLDQLRHSLLAPLLFVWLLATWIVLPGAAWVFTLWAFVSIALPVFIDPATSLLMRPRNFPRSRLFASIGKDVRTKSWLVVVSASLLAHQAYLMTDALVRTFYRTLVSRKKLLDLFTTAQAEHEARRDLAACLWFMLPAELLALLCGAFIFVFRFDSLSWAAPFLTVWIASPFVAYWLNQPATSSHEKISGDDLRFARKLARQTWRFFETFVGSEDNWLPPESYRENPQPVIAHNTSPTNIGLLLLSTVAARDFGFVSLLEFIERQELTLATLSKLATFHGHFFNKYNTTTLEPFQPQYVSTVDSGNLAGHLIVLKQASIDLSAAKLFDERTTDGLAATIDAIAQETANPGIPAHLMEVGPSRQLRDEIAACQQLISSPETHDNLSSWFVLLDSLIRHASEIDDIVNALANVHGEVTFKELRWWIGALQHQLRSSLRDANVLVAWGHLLPMIDADIHERGEAAKEQWKPLLALLHAIPSVAELPQMCDSALVALAALQTAGSATSEPLYTQLTSALESSITASRDTLLRLSQLAKTCDEMVEEMNFQFLFDIERKLFTVGYNVTASRADDSYHDLFASEARLASFVAIAKGDIPKEHWFRTRRPLTRISGGRALISWSGGMSDYLMPLLIMRNYPDTLLDETYRTVVHRHIEYGRERAVPWGISEAAYNARDHQFNYQLGPFGVPGIGFKRGLAEDLVVAPHATMLAAEINPSAAMENLWRFRRGGALGAFGFYDAIDFSQNRLPRGEAKVLIQTFVSHHQGMSLVALDNLIHEGRIRRLFHSDPRMRSTELLLQEQIPTGVPLVQSRSEMIPEGRNVQWRLGVMSRVYTGVDLETPRTQLLSNGTYSVMLTTAGAGYSKCGPDAVTRWREDVTRDNWGSFIYLRDLELGVVWSAGYQPIKRRPRSYEVAFAEDKADFRRSDGNIDTHLEVLVSANDNAEVRRVSLTNNSNRTREIEITSYAEVVLTTSEADAAHPAFSNLFIETEFVTARNAILAHRRPLSSEEQPIWGIHTVVVEPDPVRATQYETDRGRFLGRGRTPANPIAVMEDRPLSNTTGAVLDPVFSLRRRVSIPPNTTVRCTFSTAIAQSREQALELADKYHDPNIFEHELRLAWTEAQVEKSHFNISTEEAHLFQRLAGRMIYSDPFLRSRPHVLALNTKAQSSLWPYGITGNLPILLVRVEDVEHLSIVRKILRGHEYLHYKGLHLDLVILNDEAISPASPLQQELESLVRTRGLQSMQDKPGGVFLRRADNLPESDRILFHAAARAVIVAERGSLEEQMERLAVEEPLPLAFVPRQQSQIYPEPVDAARQLTYFNGLGGFDQGGREYVILLGRDQWTPAPWTNVIANQEFGFQVTETGGGYTWSANSRENRLTPWSNDAVSDPPGEVIYIRDEDTGSFWSPTPLPIRETESYLIRHGQGYTVFEHTSHGISQELLVFVPLDSPVKISLMRLRNRTSRKRMVTVTSYNELVLGVQRASSSPYLITEIDVAAGTIFARNPFNNEFAQRVAFAATSEALDSATCDRKEFLGRNGTLDQPAALRRVKLAGREGAGVDPCAALQIVVELAPHQAKEFVFVLGEAETMEEAKSLVGRFQQPAIVNQAFEKVLAYWDEVLGTIEVKTPDQALDTMLNRWLLYQTLSCRIWARTAFYQSSGAFGFRDQLQDVMAIVYSRPDIAREQILLASRHQFKEGDVQHWWHPPSGRGLRTRISDDLLWLPFVTAFYINVTGDKSVLDEMVPFLEQPQLGAEEPETQMEPTVSAESASVHEHCARALDRSLKTGAHGLPLMGSGDWNDGMNHVGHLGKGESVWLGWFLYATLAAFAPYCDEKERGQRYRRHMENLKDSLQENSWDGDWYRRAFFDNGTLLGSIQNEECRIDSTVQSWSVISGATADPYLMGRAMAAVEEYLIRRGDGLITLLTPPFDKGKLDPGYIKSYVPGVRENGGQYTHAAVWTLIAFAMLGDGDRAGELFSMLNPINHSATRAGLHKYKVEPYVVAGDVYAVPPHTGRGGWSWYTGAAGWMYRAGLESILGFKLFGDRLQIDPCIPRWWRDFEIIYRRVSTTYRIKVENPQGVMRGVSLIELDDTKHPDGHILLTDDGRTHLVRVVLGENVGSSGPEVLKAVQPVLELNTIMGTLSVKTIRELADTPARIIELSGLERLPVDLQNTVEALKRAAGHAAQFVMMRNLSIRGQSLEDAIGEVEKIQQNIKFMRSTATRDIQSIIDQWLEVLLPLRSDIQAQRVSLIRNPFIAGKPIDPKRYKGTNLFSGRKDIIEEIGINILGTDEPSPLLLHGPRRMGKTSILLQLPALLGPKFASAIMDLQRSDNTESLQSLLINICNAVRKSLALHDIQVAPLDEEKAKEKPFGAFIDWLEEVGLGMNDDMRIVLCFDEYEKLQEIMDREWPKRFLDTLRSIHQHDQRVVPMFTGVKTFEDLGPEWVEHFTNARYIRVSFLKFEEVRPLLEQPVPQLEITYEAGAMEALFEATSGQPFLTQTVALKLFELLRFRTTAVSLSDVGSAIEKAVGSGQPYFAFIWQDAGKRGQAILSALAKGAVPPDDAEAMQLLVQSDVLYEDGRFRVPMVEQWVKKKIDG